MMVTGYNLSIRRVGNAKQQERWMTCLNSKLYSVKQRIEEWKPSYNSNRQYEVRKLSLEHTQMTHEY